jgi:hypothetical protein
MFDSHTTAKITAMIIFVKIWINTRGLSEQLRKDTRLEFTADKINTETGEDHSGRRIATIRNLKIVINGSGMVEVTGSLHKYANGGEHNHDDFTFDRLQETVEEVSALLRTPPEKVTIHNIEFGVNIAIHTPPFRFLDNILNYRFRLPDVRSFGGRGYLKQWQHQNFIVKVYDKKQQYHLDTNTLRFEVKVMAMAYFKNVEVRTMADLLDSQKLAVLGVILRDTKG